MYCQLISKFLHMLPHALQPRAMGVGSTFTGRARRMDARLQAGAAWFQLQLTIVTPFTLSLLLQADGLHSCTVVTVYVRAVKDALPACLPAGLVMDIGACACPMFMFRGPLPWACHPVALSGAELSYYCRLGRVPMETKHVNPDPMVGFVLTAAPPQCRE